MLEIESPDLESGAGVGQVLDTKEDGGTIYVPHTPSPRKIVMAPANGLCLPRSSQKADEVATKEEGDGEMTRGRRTTLTLVCRRPAATNRTQSTTLTLLSSPRRALSPSVVTLTLPEPSRIQSHLLIKDKSTPSIRIWTWCPEWNGSLSRSRIAVHDARFEKPVKISET